MTRHKVEQYLTCFAASALVPSSAWTPAVTWSPSIITHAVTCPCAGAAALAAIAGDPADTVWWWRHLASGSLIAMGSTRVGTGAVFRPGTPASWGASPGVEINIRKKYEHFAYLSMHNAMIKGSNVNQVLPKVFYKEDNLKHVLKCSLRSHCSFIVSLAILTISLVSFSLFFFLFVFIFASNLSPQASAHSILPSQERLRIRGHDFVWRRAIKTGI